MSRVRWLALLAVTVVAAAALVTAVITRDAGPQHYEADGTILESVITGSGQPENPFPKHGPQLCLGGLLSSNPPQCNGIPVVDWDWGRVAGEKSRLGTTWKSVHVEGLYNGSTFSVERVSEYESEERILDSQYEPACDDPMAVDPKAGNEGWKSELTDAPGLAAMWVNEGRGPEGSFLGNLVVRPGFLEEATAHARKYYAGYLCVVEKDQRLLKDLEADFARLDDVLTQPVIFAGVNYFRGLIEAKITVVDDQARREIGSAFDQGVVELTGGLRPI